MELFGKTDVGRIRSENQDICAYKVAEDTHAIFVVCDGMGGAQSGNIASKIAAEVFIEHINRYIRPEMSDKFAHSILVNAINFANYEVYKKAGSDDIYSGMGTTLVGGFITNGNNRVLLANIGDSRAYHLNAESIRKITRDHSVVEEMITKGDITAEQARRHPRRNLITRALGTDERVRADMYPVDLLPGEGLILCSDGLSGMVEDKIMFEYYNTYTDTQQCVEQLINAANENGGNDNITALVIRI